MAELHPPETDLNGGGGGGGGVGGGGGGGGGAGGGQLTSSETVGSKRQRRPSVRLAEVGGGDQLYESHQPHHHRRTTTNTKKQWRQHQQQNLGHKEASKSSKTRALMNLSSDNGGEFNETLDGGDLGSVAIGSWRVKDSSKKRGSLNVSASVKRVRSNWVSKFDDSSGGNVGAQVEEKYAGGEDIEEEEEEDEEEDHRKFDVENLESSLKEQNPINDSLENLGDGNERGAYYDKRVSRGRDNRNVNRDYHPDGIDLSGPSENDTRDYRNIGACGGGDWGVGEDGVRIWLNNLGLGRYAPVFEIHEVDDEVLPMLTLEDLKDMGINAVGSRRKMFCAIQKLGRGFS